MALALVGSFLCGRAVGIVACTQTQVHHAGRIADRPVGFGYFCAAGNLGHPPIFLIKLVDVRSVLASHFQLLLLELFDFLLQVLNLLHLRRQGIHSSLQAFHEVLIPRAHELETLDFLLEARFVNVRLRFGGRLLRHN